MILKPTPDTQRCEMELIWLDNCILICFPYCQARPLAELLVQSSTTHTPRILVKLQIKQAQLRLFKLGPGTVLIFYKSFAPTSIYM